ncbi:MAG: PKD domain-containing protein [Anaerolineae bacterium]|nr:PKD domain-containing protein [Anaerolineae bacterium]
MKFKNYLRMQWITHKSVTLYVAGVMVIALSVAFFYTSTASASAIYRQYESHIIQKWPSSGQLGIGTSAVFTVTWSAGCQAPPSEAVNALNYAAGLWGTWISSTVPIEVIVCWADNTSGGDALGYGGPLAYQYNFPDAPWVGTAYPIALANALSGRDLMPGIEDITLEFDASVAWSFALTPTLHARDLSAGEDFVTVALHELAHGLGFIGNMYESYSVGFCRDYCPTPYDQLVVDSSGIALLSYLTPDPRELGTRLEGDANFGGLNTIAANGGAAAKLYTPNSWLPGSSLSHLDATTYQYSENQLMTPSYNGITRHPGAVTLAIFQDMGWLRADGVSNVTTTGPLVMGVGHNVTFTGTFVGSGNASLPLTYTWTTADHDPVTHTRVIDTDIVTFTWATPGEKKVTFTAMDSKGTSTTATRAALVYAVNVSGREQGGINHAYTFNATVTPDSGGFPVTYTWEATDQMGVVNPGQGTSNSVSFTWTTPGTKTITITATIAGATARTVHVITIEKFGAFLPLVQR